MQGLCGGIFMLSKYPEEFIKVLGTDTCSVSQSILYLKWRKILLEIRKDTLDLKNEK